MPTAPKQFRPAGTPSKAEAAKQYERRRGSSASRGYDSRWRKLSEWLRQQPEHVLCALCGRAPTEHIDHVVAVQGADDPLFHELANLCGLCKPCHSKKTGLCDGAFGHAMHAEGKRILEHLRGVAARRADAIEAREEGL